ncbi:Ankyrin repeat domain-containing protein 33 [Fukomys damarensis]|uniref:Ankyrin repeat domain-containing protein 33 n=1 Tax=Fukomys damarensis TaxID=885580 RepID=A0A091DMB4_FUKDA|nr:Ankyrin repeat domain-containing protein 33 [Fukomys damarensis]
MGIGKRGRTWPTPSQDCVGPLAKVLLTHSYSPSPGELSIDFAPDSTTSGPDHTTARPAYGSAPLGGGPSCTTGVNRRTALTVPQQRGHLLEEACAALQELQAMLNAGVSPQEAIQVDSNGGFRVNPHCLGPRMEGVGEDGTYPGTVWALMHGSLGSPWRKVETEPPQFQTGLMVACYRGFESVVALLSRCPFLDVNQQDKDRDTALMLAVQAGHVPLVSLLLNYFSGLDLERWDQRGLTALMKAAIQDRAECVATLLMAGADLTSVDPVRGKTALEWALLTDSFDMPPQVIRGSQVFVSYNPQGMFSQWLQPKNHTRSLVPKILLSKAPSSPSQSKLMMPRCERHQSLALPLWRYQELRMKRKQQEEELRRAQN